MSRLADACGWACLDNLFADAYPAPAGRSDVTRALRPRDPTRESRQFQSGEEEARHLRDGTDVGKVRTAQIARVLLQDLIERNQEPQRTPCRCSMMSAAWHDAVQYSPRQGFSIGSAGLFGRTCGYLADSSAAKSGRLIERQFDDELKGTFDPTLPPAVRVAGSSTALYGSFF